MLALCRKRQMAGHLAAMAGAAPADYAFAPRTWQLPGEAAALLAVAAAGGRRATYIIKPDAGCQVGRCPGCGLEFCKARVQQPQVTDGSCFL